MRRLPRFLAVILAGGLLTAVAVGLLAPPLGAVLSAHSVDPVDDLDLDPLAQRSIVLDTSGQHDLAVLHREENRKVVPLQEIPPIVVNTVLAVEDEDFYEHAGVNVRAIIRAAFTNVRAGDVRQGGSTITQQLVKNALLDSKQDFSRKLEEAVLSVRLENVLSKGEILERYLNTVYLGNGTYGIQAAAELYFGKDASQLELADAALLTGMIKNPVNLDPFGFPKAAERRRREVVRRLQAVGLIDEDAAALVQLTPLPTEPHKLLPEPDSYFVDEVIRRLLDDEALGETQQQRYNALFRGGLTIRTTLDFAAQEHAAEAVKLLPESGGRFTAALVSVDPATGAVRALVGGEGFERSKYNIATQGIGRQVGSSMKPIVLAAALDSGVSPKSTIDGSGPCEFDNPGGIPDPYEVENFEGSRGGRATLYDQTRRSVNCAYVRLGKLIGLDKVVDMAHRLGITADLTPDLSLPLGTGEIRPIEMASAYAAFAADGVHREPYFVEEIRDRHGKVIYRHEDEPRQAIEPEIAHQVTDVLKGTITSGTGTAARFADRRPAAGKTGTTSEHGDAWFVGYTRQLSTAVWVGSPVGRVEMRGVLGVRSVTGGSWPARIWQAFMGPAHDGLPVEDWPEPTDLGPGEHLRLEGEPDRPRRIRVRVEDPVELPPSTTTTVLAPEEPDAGVEVPPGDGNGGGGGGGGGGGNPITPPAATGQTEGGA